MANEDSEKNDASSQDLSIQDHIRNRLSENALKVFRRRYVRRGPDGEPAETVEGVFRRVASHIAAVEDDLEGHCPEAEEVFFDLMTELRFLPNSPTFTGAGTPLSQLAACFVLPISDDMGRCGDGIFETLRDMALIQQTGGGTGFSFSSLRPKGAVVHSSGGEATGPVGFMQVYDTASEIISQGGARRGANMAVLNIDHPDIRQFIHCKSNEYAITNFNISVGVTDEFMRALTDDGTIDLVNPHDGRTWETVPARELFDEIVEAAHRNGEPGLLFLETANRDNPTPHLGRYEATNPCLTGDTWVTTRDGPVQIEDIVGEPRRLLLNGAFHATDEEGFFSTGERETLKLCTRRGYRITLTPNHPLRVVTRKSRYVLESEWRPAGDLSVGDELVLSDNRDAVWQGPGSWEEGYLLGLLVGGGTVTDGKAVISVWGEELGAESVREMVEDIVSDLPQRGDFQGFVWLDDRKEGRLNLKAIYDLARSYGLSEAFKGVSTEIERTGSGFHRGFLRGLFDADGTVIGTQEKGVSVRLAQSDLFLLRGVQRMLHRLGIVSTLYEERREAGSKRLPDGKGGTKTYPVKPQHEIVVSCENLFRFADRVGFTDAEKAARLKERLEAYRREANRERFVDRIVSIESNGACPVYDARVPREHAFDANGLCAHNCGEQPLLPYENCCLGSINLARHVRRSDEGAGAVDWKGLAKTVGEAVRFLDDVIDANGYVPAVPELGEAAHRTRRIGLGIAGLGDVFYQLRIRYGSEESRELASQLMAFIRYHAMKTSVDLARERGPFPAIQGSIYDPDDLRWEPPRPVEPFTRQDRWGRPTLDWDALVAAIRRHGIRNAAQTTIAPTGTRSTIAGIEAYGCEPVFALAYVRHMNDKGEDVELRYTSPLFREVLEEAGLDEATRERIFDQVASSGSCQDVEEIPEEIREVFVVAQDIPAEEHVRMQAALQAFVDASISKTINFPADATPDDVAHAFQLAWELGCKGLTVYVTGSREKVVLETEETRQAKHKGQPPIVSTKVRPRPHSLGGHTYRLRTPLGTAYTTVNVNGDGEPFEVFLNVGKAGSDTAAVAEAIGRLISLVLRIPSPLSSTKRLNQVVRQLKGIGGGRPMGFGRDRVRSLPDGVAQVLAEHLGLAESPEATRRTEQLSLFPEGDLCPECGQATLVFEEGCRHCYTCGYSEC
jgi:ribonucleoside-diphosphate reductase alpha chain